MNGETTSVTAGPFGQLTYSTVPGGGPSTYPNTSPVSFMDTAQRLVAGKVVDDQILSSGGVGPNQSMDSFLLKVLLAIGGAFLVVGILNFVRALL